MQPAAAAPLEVNTKPDNKPIAPHPVSRPDATPKGTSPSTTNFKPTSSASAPVATVPPVGPIPTATVAPRASEREVGERKPFGSFAMNRGSGPTVTLKSRKVTLPSDIPSWFSENDKDADGMVGFHEWPKDRRAEFTKLDRNADGMITVEEAMRTVAKPTVATTATAPASTSPASTVASNDPDASTKSWAEGTIKRYGGKKMEGRIFADEMPFFMKKERFSEFDANKDGSMDVTELTAFLKATRDTSSSTSPSPTSTTVVAGNDSSRGGDSRGGDFNRGGENRRESGGGLGGERREFRMGGNGGDNRGGGGSGEGRRGFGPGGSGNGDPDAWVKTMFGRLDKKQTGKLTKEDFPEYMRNRHAEYDTNRDGVVTFEEYKAGMTSRFRRN